MQCSQVPVGVCGLQATANDRERHGQVYHSRTIQFFNLVMGTNTTDISGHINYTTPQPRRKTFIYSDLPSTVYCFPERQLQWQS